MRKTKKARSIRARKEVHKMTIRELRQALTEINNQNMTVQELRAILFEQEDQDKEICPYDLFKMTIEK
jgi:hypothetical protein